MSFHGDQQYRSRFLEAAPLTTGQKRMLFRLLYLNPDESDARRFSATKQLRHARYGLYQGTKLQMLFWHVLSQTPEFGVYEFPSEESAVEFTEYIIQAADIDPDELHIEPFDYAQAGRIHAESAAAHLSSC